MSRGHASRYIPMFKNEKGPAAGRNLSPIVVFATAATVSVKY